MPRAMWSGAISFGLVNIPVKMYAAITDKGVHFHQIHEKSKCRIRQKLVCDGTDKQIPKNELVKGYEIAPDQYVLIKDDELEALTPEAGKRIEITEFVDLGSIDPIYYDKPYYLLPEEHSARPYQLLVTAMSGSRKVGMAKFVMRNKEYLSALRPLGRLICLETMHFADEVVNMDLLSVGWEKQIPPPEAKELRLAEQLIAALSEEFHPEKYHDDYREKVRSMIQRKAQGEEIITQAPAAEPRGRVIDLLAALEESLSRTGRNKRENRKKRAHRSS